MYGWREIVPIYEDTEYGRGIIPYLADALQQNGTRLVVRTNIPPSATSAKISKKLSRLKDMRKTIFVLHMTVSVGLKVLSVAKKEGMMSEGYAWIVTDGLSSLVDPLLNSKVMDSMQGIVGVRPYIPITQKFQHFQTKLKQRLSLSLSLGLCINALFKLNFNYCLSFMFDIKSDFTIFNIVKRKIRSMNYYYFHFLYFSFIIFFY